MILEKRLIGFLQCNCTRWCLNVLFDCNFLEISSFEIFSPLSLLNPKFVVSFALKHFRSSSSKHSVSSLLHPLGEL